jgi:nicotinate-nucleotide adenylyltransferase
MSFVPAPLAAPAMSIGLLGGSFNPAHDGHLHVSREALRRLGLDRVWWLVSPQNPLKSETETAPLADRVKTAQDLVRDPRIQVTDLEQRWRTQYSVDTMARLNAQFPDVNFVWLMGADIFGQLPEWNRWIRFVESVPIAVFDRPGYTLNALHCLPAIRWRARRLDTARARLLAKATPPAWCFLPIPRHGLSSSAIRSRHET